MTTLREAAEQALDALMYCEPHCEENPVGFEKWADVMPALREALAQREWVGLTDEDLSVCDEDGIVLARYWEAKLKEKNTGPDWDSYKQGAENGAVVERQRIVNLLMIQHEMAKDKNNYWHVAAQLIQADVASDT